MKKITYLLLALNFTLGLKSYSQNIFPNVGNVGIGTLTPNSALQIATGTLKIDQYGFSAGSSGMLRAVGFDKNGGIHGNIDTSYKFELPTTSFFNLSLKQNNPIPLQGQYFTPTYINSVGTFVFPDTANPLPSLHFNANKSNFAGDLAISPNGSLILQGLINGKGIGILGIDRYDGRVLLLDQDFIGTGGGGGGTGSLEKYWTTIGNAGTTSNNFLGTRDAKDLSIVTNNVERLNITSSGSFGFNAAEIVIDGVSNPSTDPLLNLTVANLNRKIISNRLVENNSETLFITGKGDAYFAGNVGIGTINTGSFKLAVEGKIAAREIKVTLQNPFPDFVFEKDFKLMSLCEMEQFIHDNKHLPGIPSAKEISDSNGIELGEMNRLLLQKIEELTIHLINLSKENEAIRSEIAAIKK